MRYVLSFFLTGAFLVAGVVPAGAEPMTPFVQTAHYGFSGVISKIRSGILFVKTEKGLQPRTVSPSKADRVGLHDAKVGEQVNLLVDSGNVLIDVSRTDRFFPDHRFIAGTVRYSDPYWSEIQLSTPDGPASYEVDPLAGSKLSVLQEGMPITIELDADNVTVDIHRGR